MSAASIMMSFLSYDLRDTPFISENVDILSYIVEQRIEEARKQLDTLEKQNEGQSYP